MDVKGYEEVARVLELAYGQTARGKGKERHAAEEQAFVDQPIMAIARMVGIGYQTGQLMKKAQEATRMASRGKTDAARAELLGVIIYAVAAHLLLDEQESEADDPIDGDGTSTHIKREQVRELTRKIFGGVGDLNRMPCAHCAGFGVSLTGMGGTCQYCAGRGYSVHGDGEEGPCEDPRK